MSLKQVFEDTPTIAKQVLGDKDFWGRIAITLAFVVSVFNAADPSALTGWLVVGLLGLGVWLIHD